MTAVKNTSSTDARCPTCGAEIVDATAPQVKEWRLSIPYEVPSLNRNASKGSSRHAYNRLRGNLGLAVKATLAYTPIPKATHHRSLVITRRWGHGRGKRAYDYDNLVGGCKPFLDSLVSAGVLVDDSPRWCSVEYHQRRSDEKQGRTEVVIQEIVQ